jgi:hypothetical protein
MSYLYANRYIWKNSKINLGTLHSFDYALDNLLSSLELLGG